MAAAAFMVGVAIHLNNGFYTLPGLCLVTGAIVLCAAVTLLPPVAAVESLPPHVVTGLIAAAVLIETVLLWRATPVARWGLACVGVLSFLQVFRLRRFRLPLFAVTLAVFCFVAAAVFLTVAKNPLIDVFVFQQRAARGLLRGLNPYEPRFPNIYGPDTPFYGPGVLDAENRLTVGLPYPPLSLLMALPGYVLGGDCRYADIAAVAASALLMMLVGAGRWTGLTAALFLLTPGVFLIIQSMYTDTLFVLTFSLVMICALRWRRGLPFALGLFVGTKQYSVLSVPLIVLLLEPGEGWMDAARLTTKAFLIAGVVTLPFVLWDPYAFWRSVVQFQFMQPLRMDALSHLVWMHARLPRFPFLLWTPFIALVPTTALVLWRCGRSPAQFAGAVTLVHLVFFAFNKQAFANYYYFVIATACWAAVVSDRVMADG